MSAPGGDPLRRPKPRTALPVQLGQTLFFLGVLMVFFGFFLDGPGVGPLVGGVLALAGVVLFVVGLRRRRPPS